jgi:hypothetical protein
MTSIKFTAAADKGSCLHVQIAIFIKNRELINVGDSSGPVDGDRLVCILIGWAHNLLGDLPRLSQIYPFYH